MKILLIEDNPDHAEIIFNCVNYEQDTDIKWVKKLDEAAQAIQEPTHYDVILSDLRLPGSEVDDTLEFLHKLSDRFPVIALTTLNDQNTAKKAIAQGAQDYIVKSELRPFIINRSLDYALERFELRRQLLQQNEELKNFTAILAHDFSAPIANIVRASDLLLVTQKEQDDETKELMTIINSQAKKSRKTISALHQTTKIQLDTSRNFKSIKLSDLVNDLLEDFKNEKANISLHNDVELNVIPDKLKIVLQNLILNSIKYSDDVATINISVSTTDSEHTVITFTDQGRGISPELAPHLFSAFKKGKTSNGLGLGLYNVSQIIKQHNGEIQATPNLDKGTTFTISLPAKNNAN